MIGLQNFLRACGHDLAEFGKWVEEGAPIVGSCIELIDPPLTPVVQMVEGILKDLENIHRTPTADDLKAITKAATLLHAVQTTIANGQLRQIGLEKVLEKAVPVDQKV